MTERHTAASGASHVWTDEVWCKIVMQILFAYYGCFLKGRKGVVKDDVRRDKRARL